MSLLQFFCTLLLMAVVMLSLTAIVEIVFPGLLPASLTRRRAHESRERKLAKANVRAN